jgi:hypothetical protein
MKNIFVAGLLVLAACQNNSKPESPAAPVSAIPADISPEIQAEMAKTKPLSLEQKKSLSKYFKDASAKSPSMSLLLNEYQSSEKLREEMTLRSLIAKARLF